jgi:hypothetical protein
MDETTNCTTCGKEISTLAVFPGGRCVECHAAIWDQVPTAQLPRPDFTRAIHGHRRKVR